MALAQDPIAATRIFLQADATITALLSSRVFGMEVTKAEAKNMPRKAIVINGAGGVGQGSFVATFKIRLDFFCYGEIPDDAWEVYLTLHTVLKQMDRQVVNSTMLMSFIHSAGPFPTKDQKTDWPVVIDTWILEFNTTECP